MAIERSETGGGDPDGSAGEAGGRAPRGIEQVLRDVLALSDEDREKLLVALHQSLEPDDGDFLSQPEWDAAWAAEIDRRLNDLATGRARTYTHQEVMAELRARLLRR